MQIFRLVPGHGSVSHRVQLIIMVNVILLELMLGALGLPQAVQSQSRDLQWTRIDKPGLTGNVVVPGSDVSEIAIGSSICYALDINPPGRIYRSMSGGLRWEDISPFLNAAGAVLPATKVAVAPDDSAIVAVATNGGTNFYLSVDGGITWGNMHMGAPIGTIQSIAISRPYGEYKEQRDILVGTAKFGAVSAYGQVLMLHLGSVVPYWITLNLTIGGSSGIDISAVAFSPSYTDDWTILAIASTDTTVNPPSGKTYLCIGTDVDVQERSVYWNVNPGWPIEIPPGGSVGDSATVTLIAGGLALPSNFATAAGAGKSTLVYAFYRVDSTPLPSPDPSNAYQIDVSVPPIPVVAFASPWKKRYSSIALSGNRLLAGEVLPNDALTIAVRISLNANSTTPAFTNSGYPYGQTNAKVAWSGNVAYCGTSGAESGFSISNDNGAHWSQVGLIDTTVILRDVAAASSPQSIFVTSTSTTGIESVWRSAGEPLGQYWGRVLATDGLTNKFVVRISPQYRDDYTLYVTEVATELPVITIFNANPSTIIANPATLQWNVTGATLVSIDQGIGVVAASGTQAVTPGVTTVYTITASNAFGTVTASVTVTVVAAGLPQINIFTANPGSINVGQSSMLQWNVIGATSVSINRDIGTVSANGTTTVSPTITTRYTITATNAAGSVTAYTTITVTPQFWVSHDRGNAWKQCYAPPGIIDLAVVDKKICYVALPSGRVSRSDSSGQFWRNAVSTELPEIAMLSLAEPDTILVGGRHGDVAYSSDGGMSFTRIPENLRNDAPVQVTADARYQQNSLIYAGSSNIIYRWAINQSQRWDIIRTATAGRQISGMASVKGILYGLWHTAAPAPVGSAPSGAERSLDPSLPLVSLEWDTSQAGATAARFNITPTALKYTITDSSVILWTIDTGPPPPAPQDDTVMVYFDCLAWNQPSLTMSQNTVIGCDPATGRDQEINFTWEDICADNRYQLQIAKDDKFTLRVFDSGDNLPFLLPADITSPALVYFASGGSTFPTLAGIPVPALECGHGYYWRVRARAAVTGDIIRSPWSEVRAFTIKAGFRVTTPYYGPQLLAPDNGCGCPCDAPAAFSWTPFKETTDYRFELSTNPDMSRPLVTTTVKTTAYQYRGQLKCDTTYFWRVMAVQPAPGEWSAVFSFKVRPAEPTATTIPATTAPPAQTPPWVWVVIGLGGMLVVVIIIMLLLLNRAEEVEE